MQITIDTKKDSPEEIKKAIQLLSMLVQGRATHSTNIFDDEPAPEQSQSGGNAFANIFGDAPSEQPQEKQEKKEDAPEVMLY